MWFKRTKGASSVPIPVTADALALIGRQAFPRDSAPTHAGNIGAYYLPAYEACGAPPPGSEGWDDFVDRFLSGLLHVVESADDRWALPGAFEIMRDLLGADDANPRYAELIDATMVFLRDAGVPYQLLPPFALNRWYHRVGMVNLRPANWPASIDS